MAGLSELERLVSDSKRDKKLVSHFALLGHDTGAFVHVANKLGYHFTDNDVNDYVAQKTASVTKKAAGASSAKAAPANAATAAVVSTSTLVMTVVDGGVVVMVSPTESVVVVGGVVVVT
jgi:succinylarginine dihydrolase